MSNNCDTAYSFNYNFDQAGAFPETFTAFCFDAATKRYDISGTITIPPKSTVSRWIIVGDADYRNDLITQTSTQLFSVLPIFPNPSRATVNIRYTVPFGAREHITIGICNILGKKIWHKQITGYLKQGLNQISWNGTDETGRAAGSGLNFITITVINEAGKTVSKFDRCVTLLR